jgi:hypothetical protein
VISNRESEAYHLLICIDQVSLIYKSQGSNAPCYFILLVGYNFAADGRPGCIRNERGRDRLSRNSFSLYKIERRLLGEPESASSSSSSSSLRAVLKLWTTQQLEGSCPSRDEVRGIIRKVILS